MHENRETSRASIETVDRSAKAPSHNADVHAMEGSDCCVVPMKQPNKEGQSSAEAAEGRQQPKENDAQSNTPPTQCGARVSQGLSGVRRAARERRQERFTALLHHVTINLLFCPSNLYLKWIFSGAARLRAVYSIRRLRTLAGRLIPGLRSYGLSSAMICSMILEADFDPNAYGYRPKRGAQEAIQKVHELLRAGYTMWSVMHSFRIS